MVSHCLGSDFGPALVQIVLAGRSPRFHSYSQTRALVAESLEIAQKYSKNKLKKRKEEKLFLFFFGFCCISLMLTKGHAYIGFAKEEFQSEDLICITHIEC